MRLEVKDICFSYLKERPVLDGVSFSVNKGEILGILGGSGCGKSTLLRIISGVLRKSKTNCFSGIVTIDGTINTQNLRRDGMIGLMFQQTSLLPNLNLRQNVFLPKLLNKNLSVSEKAVEELIESVGLSDFQTFLPKQLSGGMQKRVELARAFVSRPKLLLLDEPFSSLDYAWKMELYPELMTLIRLNKSAAVIVSHDINELVLLSDKILILSKDGRFVGTEVIIEKKPEVFNEKEIGFALFSNKDTIAHLQTTILKDK